MASNSFSSGSHVAIARGDFSEGGEHVYARAIASALAAMHSACAATWPHTWRKRSTSSSDRRSWAVRMRDSYSFISGVMNRSPPTSVWRRT